ncbi:MAG: nitrite reductase, nitrite reductase (NO-forming) [Chloroflexi bacterium CSP1-4]|nr:MAG: nitrite reductase, nitrite reductase (NO-forming) [Chloroflexi bacterium CSP1-4]
MRRSLARIAALPVIALLVAACASGGGAVWTYAPQTPGASQPAGSPSAEPSQPTTGGPSLGTLEISGFDIGFKPNELTVDKAGTYTIKFTNTGQIPHDFSPEGGSATIVDPGQTATIDINVPQAGLKFSCTIPGHAAAGMTGTIVVIP